MSDNPRPITYQSCYTACLVDRPLAPEEEKITIAGKHCESGDVLLKDICLPYSKSGEVLAIFGTGAYNASMGSNYNTIPRPAAVIVNAVASVDIPPLSSSPSQFSSFNVKCRKGRPANLFGLEQTTGGILP